MPKLYSFTLKYNSLDIADFYLGNLYSAYIDYINKHFCHIHEIAYEETKTIRLHVHATISMRASKTPRMLYYKPFHVNYSLLKNPRKWTNYLSKGQSQSLPSVETLIFDPKWTHQEAINSILTHYRKLSDLYYNILDLPEQKSEQADSSEEKKDSIPPGTPV